MNLYKMCSRFFFSLFIGYILLGAASCKSNKNIPNVSNIPVALKWMRYDQDFFSMDTLALKPALFNLNKKYEQLNNIFLNQVLGVNDSNYVEEVKAFIKIAKPLFDSSQKQYATIATLQKEFTQAFQFVKYYFPNYAVPNIITVLGPYDALAQTASGELTPNFMGVNFLAINLQFYLGNMFSLYNQPFFIEQIAPQYRSRRFSKEYIISDALGLVVDDIYPDESRVKPLIIQMVEKGKQGWVLDKFLPYSPDTIKTGYTTNQLAWCNKNEGLIWSYILKNEDLYTIDHFTIQKYIGEAPFTQGLPPDVSPGNIGRWIGRQIVKKYEQLNPNLSIEKILKTPASAIIEAVKYKPK